MLKMGKKSELLAIFERYGYTSQASLARAIQKKGVYNNLESLRCYLNQVFNGRRKPSSKLLNALSSVCNNDLEISAIMGSTSSKEEREASLEYGLKCKFEDAYYSLKEEFLQSDSSGKMAFILDFERYVKDKKRICGGSSD